MFPTDVAGWQALLTVLVSAAIGGGLRAIIGYHRHGGSEPWSWGKSMPAFGLGAAVGIVIEMEPYLDAQLFGMVMTVLAASGAAMLGQDGSKAIAVVKAKRASRAPKVIEGVEPESTEAAASDEAE